MIIIIHKVNTIRELLDIDKSFGVEIDIRSYGKDLILNHEPMHRGELLEDYLSYFNHKYIIANIKESGVEKKVIEIFKKFKIENFFLLDVEFPFILDSYNLDFKKIALRFSDYEYLDFNKKFNQYFNWLWIDTYKDPSFDILINEKIAKIKKCLVCPERWNRPEKISEYKSIIDNYNLKLDAVMTNLNYINYWLK